MQREVITRSDIPDRPRAPRAPGAPSAPGPTPAETTAQPDDYKTALMKLIPGETIGVYTLLMALVAAATQTGAAADARILFLFLLFGVVFTPIYLNRVAGVTKVGSIALSTVAFVIYVYARGDWFQASGLYVPILGAALLIMGGALLPILAGVPARKTPAV